MFCSWTHRCWGRNTSRIQDFKQKKLIYVTGSLGTYTTELVVPQALDYLKSMQAKPTQNFFLWLPFHLIHGPNQVPDEYLALYPTLNLSATARSLGMCGVCDCSVTDHGPATGGSDVTWEECRTVLAMAAALDWAVGTVVDALKANGQYGNTIIFYSSDNGAQGGQGGTSYPLRGFKTQLYEGGIRVPGFVSGGSPLIPGRVRGTVSVNLYHVTDWLPTIVGLAGGNTTRNLPLDGHDIWASIVAPSTTPNPRTELLHNINPACGKGYVNPNAGLRLGDWKLLVECFNVTTMAPNGGKVELFHIATDPYEQNEVAHSHPDQVKMLLARMAEYAASPDQVPPTLFWPQNNSEKGVAPWNYQCPQCRHGGALAGADGYHFDPWCDHVQCGTGP